MHIVTFERLREPRRLAGQSDPGSMGAAALGFETLEGTRQGTLRLGALLCSGSHAGAAVDLNRALAVKLASEDAGAPEAEAASQLPADPLQFLQRWPAACEAAREILEFVERALERYDAPDLVGAGVVTPRKQIRLAAPVPRPGKIIAVDTVDGTANLLAPTSVVGPEDEILIPPTATLTSRAALAAVVATAAREVPESRALECLAGYCIANDVAAREQGGQPVPASLGRSGDTFTPLGPMLVTADEVPDPEDLGLRITRSGRTVQSTRTKVAGAGLAAGIARITRLVTLEPGDLVLVPIEPPEGASQALQDGEVLEIEIERLGRLVSHVRRR